MHPTALIVSERLTLQGYPAGGPPISNRRGAGPEGYRPRTSSASTTALLRSVSRAA